MRKHRKENESSLDPVTKMARDLAEVLAERSRMNKELLVALAHAMATNEMTQRRFRNAVLIRLSSIETVLTEVQGAQLVQFWDPGHYTDEQRTKYVKEVEERMSKASQDLGLKMIRYIYEESEVPDALRDRRRKWSDWEI